MPARKLASLRGAHQVALLTLGLWIMAYVVFLLPNASAPGGLQPYIFALYAPMAGAGLLISPVFYLLIRKTERMALSLRISLLTVCAAAAGLLHACWDGFFWRFFARLNGDELVFADIVRSGFLIYIFVYGLYATALGLILSSLKVQEGERALMQARTAAHQAQLDALRFQLNPHFLFNTLNAVSSLIVTGRNVEAETMTAKLSDFMRASLAADPHGEVTLDDEFATLQAYLDIEAVRFGDRMAVEVACPAPLLTALLPSLILQPLVENAIKYAVTPARRPVTIRVEARQLGDSLEIVVEDDGAQAFGATPKSGAGVGLANTGKRLAAFYGERGSMQAMAKESGFKVVLRLPLAHQEVQPTPAVSLAAA